MKWFRQRYFLFVVPSILSCLFVTDLLPAMAAVVPPEGVPSEEKREPSVTVQEPQTPSKPKDPFEESGNRDLQESMRQKRERRTIIIILAVILLLCAYWLTSGRLHHRIPR